MASAGEMFINLGIKGADKTFGDLMKTNDAMKDLRSVSIETKAAILAVLYGIEKLVTTSGQLGTTLKNFSTISGVSADTIQRYEFQAKKAGVANEALRNSFLKVQESMMNIRAGEGLPKWLAAIITTLAQRGVDLGPDFVARAQKDPTLAFQAMEKYAQIPDKDIDRSTRAITLQQAGWDPAVITAMMKGLFSPEKLSSVPNSAILKSGEIDKLDALRARWDILITEIEVFIAKMTAKFLQTDFGSNHHMTRDQIDEIEMKKWDNYFANKVKADKELFTWVKGVFTHGDSKTPVTVSTTVNLHGPNGKKTIKNKSTHQQSASEIISQQTSAQTDR